MHGVGVSCGMHRNGGNAQFLARAQDAQGNLAAIGYQDLIEHDVPGSEKRGRMRTRASETRSRPAIRGPLCYSIITSGSPNSTGWPSSTRICVTMPERGDGIWFMVFIASMISRVCPTETFVPTSMNGLAPGSDAQYAVPTIGEGTTPGCLARSMLPDGPTTTGAEAAA